MLELNRRARAALRCPSELSVVAGATHLFEESGTLAEAALRPLEQRLRDGALPGAVVIDRNVLEWRLDPSSPDRIGEPDRSIRRVVIVCNEGYSSSLAAHTLQGLGLVNATDLRGGYQAWMVWKALSPESGA